MASTARPRRLRPSSTASSLSEPNRLDAPPARTMPLTPSCRRRRGRPRSRPGFERGARSGHVAVRGPAQHAAPAEVLEERHHVLAARPGRVAQGGRRERRGRGPGPVPGARACGTRTRRRRGRPPGRRSGPAIRAPGWRPAGSQLDAPRPLAAAAPGRRAAAQGGPSGSSNRRAGSSSSRTTSPMRRWRTGRWSGGPSPCARPPLSRGPARRDRDEPQIRDGDPRGPRPRGV